MKTKVLFVCLGNICRSPLAEALFSKHVLDLGLVNEFQIDSCGTSNYHIGDYPDTRSYQNALVNGVRIEHRGRQLTYDDLIEYDYLLAMDRSNLADIQKLTKQDGKEGQLLMMREFDPGANQIDVPDPYYGGDNGFQEVFEILERSTSELVLHLQKRRRI